MDKGDNHVSTAKTDSNVLPNPPSIEKAYRRKCIGLKKRLSEVETTNDDLRLQNMRGRRYVEKMRLESCILLQRLSELMGMAEQGETEDNNKHPDSNAKRRALELMRANADGLGIPDGDAEADLEGPEHEEHEDIKDGEQHRRGGKSSSTSKRNATAHEDSDDDMIEGNSEAQSSTQTKVQRNNSKTNTTPSLTSSKARTKEAPPTGEVRRTSSRSSAFVAVNTPRDEDDAANSDN